MKFVSEYLRNQKKANHDRYCLEVTFKSSMEDSTNVGQFIAEDYKISSFSKNSDILYCLVNSSEEAKIHKYMTDNYSDKNPQFKKLSDVVVYSDLDFSSNYRTFKMACRKSSFPIFTLLSDRASTCNVGCFKKDLKAFFEFMTKNYNGGSSFEEDFGSYYN